MHAARCTRVPNTMHAHGYNASREMPLPPPRTLAVHTAVLRSVSSVCALDEIPFRGNTRPLVTVLDKWGEAQAVHFPGFWRPYPWDSVGRGDEVGASRPGTPLMTGHDVLDRVRVVYVANALITPNGNVCDATTCYSDPMCFQGDPRNPLVDPIERQGCTKVVHLTSGVGGTSIGGGQGGGQGGNQGGHALVLRQEFSHTFSHSVFQALPQLVLLLDSLARQPAHVRNRPLRVLLSRWDRSASPLPSLIASALGIPIENISTNDELSKRGVYVRAVSASILLVPPGTNPNEAIFGRGVLRRVHARLVMPIPDETPNDKVVYLNRLKHMGRYVWNEPQVLKMLQTQIKQPQYELVKFGPHSVNNSWMEMRRLLARTRVLFGPHGTAWGHLIFLPLHRGNVHLIELHYLRHRTCYPKLHHYIDGLSHYWVLEPEPWEKKHVWLTSQARPMSATLISKPMAIWVADLHTILWHAGVAHCDRTSNIQPWPDNVWKLGSANASYRCAVRRGPPSPAPPNAPPSPPNPPPVPMVCPTLEAVLAVPREERWQRFDDPGCTSGCRAQRRCGSLQYPCCWRAVPTQVDPS